ncbi:MAG: mucoidy inhibitor MuiA family protein [Deltaproteobacteria bacterium]|nr:mucoidy inhibitor MuiA family protein [Deltaproteobacteria bacterium]
MNEASNERGRVTSVRVYTDRATITRQRRLTLEAGPGGVRFGPLPTQLPTESLEAKAYRLVGGQREPLRVAGIRAGIEYGGSGDARQKEVVARLEEVRAELSNLRDQDQHQERAANLLSHYAELATQTLSREWLDQNPAFDKWGQAFEHLKVGRFRLAGERAIRFAQKERLEEERRRLEQERSRLGRPEPLGLFVTVQLEGDVNGEVEVELGYATPNARWVPAYDARWIAAGAEQKERLRLTAIALVQQSTGEDWDEVTLIASTARPPLSEPPPELKTLTVRGVAGGPDQQIVSTTKTEARLEGAPAGPGEVASPAATVEHQARGKVSVPSSGRPVRVELFEGELPARARLEIAPRERPVAIEVVELDNSTGKVLLPGTVNVFRGKNFSGQTQLPFVANKERFRIPLGTHAGLRIRRNAKAEPEKKGLVTGALTWLYEVRTTIENVSNGPIEVLLRDRLPVSQLEDAVVKVLELEKATEVDPDTGLTKLQLTIPPHSKREIGLAFKISAPRGFSLVPPPVV